MQRNFLRSCNDMSTVPNINVRNTNAPAMMPGDGCADLVPGFDQATVQQHKRGTRTRDPREDLHNPRSVLYRQAAWLNGSRFQRRLGLSGKIMGRLLPIDVTTCSNGTCGRLQVRPKSGKLGRCLSTCTMSHCSDAPICESRIVYLASGKPIGCRTCTSSARPVPARRRCSKP